MAFAERCNLLGNPRRRNRLMARRSFWERAGVLLGLAAPQRVGKVQALAQQALQADCLTPELAT